MDWAIFGFVETYLGVQEVDRDAQQEDEHEEGEQLVIQVRYCERFGRCESPTYHHVRSQIIPGVHHWHDTEGSTCTVVSLDMTDFISASAILTERHNVLHADNKHKSRTRVARIRLRSEVRCCDEADDETELLQRPSLANSQ